jgi:hypothetical protein
MIFKNKERKTGHLFEFRVLKKSCLKLSLKSLTLLIVSIFSVFNHFQRTSKMLITRFTCHETCKKYCKPLLIYFVRVYCNNLLYIELCKSYLQNNYLSFIPTLRKVAKVCFLFIEQIQFMPPAILHLTGNKQSSAEHAANCDLSLKSFN